MQRYRSGCVGFEPHGAEVVSCGQVHGGVRGGRWAPQQGNGGLGAVFFDVLDLVGRHVRAPGQVATLGSSARHWS